MIPFGRHELKIGETAHSVTLVNRPLAEHAQDLARADLPCQAQTAAAAIVLGTAEAILSESGVVQFNPCVNSTYRTPQGSAFRATCG